MLLRQETPNPTRMHEVDKRLTLLEAKVKLIALALEGIIVTVVTALIAYFFKA